MSSANRWRESPPFSSAHRRRESLPISSGTPRLSLRVVNNASDMTTFEACSALLAIVVACARLVLCSELCLLLLHPDLALLFETHFFALDNVIRFATVQSTLRFRAENFFDQVIALQSRSWSRR